MRADNRGGGRGYLTGACVTGSYVTLSHPDRGDNIRDVYGPEAAQEESSGSTDLGRARVLKQISNSHLIVEDTQPRRLLKNDFV